MKTLATPICEICDKPISGEKAVILSGAIAVWDNSMAEHERGGILGSSNPEDDDRAYHNHCIVECIDKACGISRPVVR